MSKEDQALAKAVTAAEKLKAIGLKQYDIDKHAGVPINTVSKMLRGEVTPSLDKLKAIAAVPGKIRKALA